MVVIIRKEQERLQIFDIHGFTLLYKIIYVIYFKGTTLDIFLVG